MTTTHRISISVNVSSAGISLVIENNGVISQRLLVSKETGQTDSYTQVIATPPITHYDDLPDTPHLADCVDTALSALVDVYLEIKQLAQEG
jgi:hypothetical protein